MSRLLDAALLGVLQGLTEFLPVSSTAHLLVGARLLGFADPGGVFTVIIQFGAILAVVWLYRVRVAQLLVGLVRGGRDRQFAVAILAAFAPAVVAGLLFADFVKGVLYESFVTIALALVVGGLVMLLVERRLRVAAVHEASDISVGRALAVGVSQTLALIPGVSRSGGTIIGGMLAGLDRRAAAEFSFFLAMPTMAAAFVHDLWEIRHELSSGRAVEIAVGFVMAFVAALVVVRPFVNFVGRSGFSRFAWYRVGLGGLLLVAVASGWL
jgi:undecaprenyl-diphosphatase